MEQEIIPPPSEELKRNRHGGDRVTRQAKLDTAKREEQVVALRLRGHTFDQIGRAVGTTKSAAQRAFLRVVRRRNSNMGIQTYHQTELMGLALAEADIWKILDNPKNKEDFKIRLQCHDRLDRIRTRRIRLLGLDAPQKLDVRAIYKDGGDKEAAECLRRQKVLHSLPLEEQERLYELFAEASRHAAN